MQVIVSGKLRAQRAKSMKFKDGYMISSGQPVKEYIDSAVRHVLLRQVRVILFSWFVFTRCFLSQWFFWSNYGFVFREFLELRSRSCLTGILKESRAPQLRYLILSPSTLPRRKRNTSGRFLFCQWPRLKSQLLKLWCPFSLCAELLLRFRAYMFLQILCLVPRQWKRVFWHQFNS